MKGGLRRRERSGGLAITTEGAKKGVRPAWIAAIVAVIVIVGLSVPPGRNLTRRFFNSLRVGKVQAVNVDLSNFVGPNANSSLQQMFSQMISDKVNITLNEPTQSVATEAEASKLAGFPVQLLGRRKDAPEMEVRGAHAFDLTVDRARLQEILKEAGKSDLSLPPSIDGAHVEVRMARSMIVRYGTCPGRPSATANVATPTPTSTEYSDCVRAGRGAEPAGECARHGLDLQHAGGDRIRACRDDPDAGTAFLQNVNWRSTLGVSIPRFMRSYQAVEVNGVEGTLLNMAGQARADLHAGLGEKWHGLYADGIRRFGRGGRVGEFAAVKRGEPSGERQELRNRNQKSAQSIRAKGRGARSFADGAAVARSSVFWDRTARGRALRSRCFWAW